MVRSFSVGVLPQSLSPADRLRVNEVAGFDDAMACIQVCCQEEIAARSGNPKVFAPTTAICSAEKLLAAASSAREVYRSELLAMEASFVAELYQSFDPILIAIARALAEGDYSDLIL